MFTNKISITILATLAVACGPNASGNGGDGDGDVDGDGDGNGAQDAPCDQMDVLFVVDDSGSMEQEQANLAANFPLFVDVVHGYRNGAGEPLDYRIGVITTGVSQTVTFTTPFGTITETSDGEDGQLRPMGGLSHPWIERADGTPEELATTFAATAEVGISGPAIEMPLRAAELALGDRILDGSNAGFVRDTALTAVVIVTDEDDCSYRDPTFDAFDLDTCNPNDAAIMDPSDSIAAIDDIAGGSGRWATAVIAGETDCSSEFGDAFEANRLKDFVAGVGTNGVFSSICAGDLSAALGEALDTFESACESFPPVD